MALVLVALLLHLWVRGTWYHSAYLYEKCSIRPAILTIAATTNVHISGHELYQKPENIPTSPGRYTTYRTYKVITSLILADAAVEMNIIGFVRICSTNHPLYFLYSIDNNIRKEVMRKSNARNFDARPAIAVADTLLLSSYRIFHSPQQLTCSIEWYLASMKK